MSIRTDQRKDLMNMKTKQQRVAGLLSAALLATATLPFMASATESNTTQYTVKNGDNLWNLAITFNTTVDAIASANNISDTRLIYIDQVLTIPKAGAGPDSSGYTYYYVQSSDSLGKIAETYGTTVQQLASWNNIKNVDYITVGQLLKVGYTAAGGGDYSGNDYTGTLEAWEYLVQKGDNLYSIAIANNTTVEQLAEWNNLQNTHWIYAGTVLQVAAASSGDSSGSTNGSVGSILPGGGGSSSSGSTTTTPEADSSDEPIYVLPTPTSSETVDPSAVQEVERLVEASEYPQIDEVVAIPLGQSDATVEVAPELSTSLTLSNNTGTHTVTTESTVFEVASLYRISSMDVITWNNIADPMAIPVGTVLKVSE